MLTHWLKLLPAKLRAKIEHRPHLISAISNTGWLFSDQILRMVVGLLVGVWIARYLGPELFGLLNYALAFVALFGPIANLGLNGIVVRDLVKDPSEANITLGTTFLLQFAGGFLASVLVVIAVSFARPDESLTKLIVVMLGSIMVFKSTEVVKYWFESRVQSKYTVWVENGIFMAFSAIKMGLIIVKAPLIAFVWAFFLEGLLISIGLLSMYVWRGGHLRMWRIKYGRAKALLKDSWPLILSGLTIMVYMRIDQIMLGQMLGDKAVGIYSAAVRISEFWYFIPMAIVTSVFPSIIKAKEQSELIYYQWMQKLYNLMVLLALVIAIPMTFLSEWLVVLIFGNGYAQAGPVLALHIWAGVFVFLGVASGSWYLTENLQMLAFKRTLLGSVINILANLLLIPEYGILGAAIGTVFSQMAASYLFDFLHPKTRNTFWMKSKSFVSFYRCRFVT